MSTAAEVPTPSAQFVETDDTVLALLAEHDRLAAQIDALDCDPDGELENRMIAAEQAVFDAVPRTPQGAMALLDFVRREHDGDDIFCYDLSELRPVLRAAQVRLAELAAARQTARLRPASNRGLDDATPAPPGGCRADAS
jgi:hypothetical protein